MKEPISKENTQSEPNEQNENFFYKNNRLQQLRGFYYSVRFCSISKAAKEINLTQSTVTLQIQSLERDLGITLINRGNKDNFLTKDGKEFYKMACPLIQEFESVANKFRSKLEKDKEEGLKIAVHHVAITHLMPKIITEFKKSHPNVKITLHNISPSEASSRLVKEEVDFIIFPNLPSNPEIEIQEIISYRPILIVRKNHPLSSIKIKSLKDLRKFDLIRIDQNLITLPLFEEAFKTYELEGSIDFENGNWEMLKSLVQEGDFAALVSTICVKEGDENFAAIDLSSFFPSMSYGFAVKNKVIKKDLVKKFLAITKDICQYQFK